MFSHELHLIADNFLVLCEDSQEFISFLEVLDSFFEAIEPSMEKIFTGGNSLNEGVNNGNLHMSKVIAFVKNNSMRSIFLIAEHMNSNLHAVDAVIFDFDVLRKEIDIFLNVYDSYCRHYSVKKTFQLLFSASALYRRIKGYVEVFSMVRTATEVYFNVGNKDVEVDLLFEGDFTLKSLGLKLISLGDLYDEIASLLSLENKELRVIRVETGSLWIKAVGDAVGIKFILDLIRWLGLYVHRNYTNEGRLSKIPKAVESIELVSELRNKIKDLGIDTSDMDDYIQSSSVAIARNLENLLFDTSSVTINGDKQGLRKIEKIGLPSVQNKRIEDHSNDLNG